MKRVIDSRRLVLGLGVLSLLSSASVVHAQEEGYAGAADPAEATIRLMETAEAELPEAVTKEIVLPPAAIENSVHGLETASENRERRENGLSKADEARERGAEMSEEAKENRENRGRFDDRPTRPDRPDPPRGPPNS